VYWFATANTPAGGKDGDVTAELLARFGHWHAPIGDLLRHTRPERILRTDIADRAPVRRWTSARVALLGDAAHPMTPNLGQGACQAIEDAVVLARLLAAGGAMADVLGAYAARRVPRANGIVTQAHRMGAVGQLENGLARGLRDGALRLFGERLGAVGLDGLYGFTV
jgi:2-polyprenyl-6-methoxyphenol hydroxylase-like FAD-dependent oxidoreductase